MSQSTGNTQLMDASSIATPNSAINTSGDSAYSEGGRDNENGLTDVGSTAADRTSVLSERTAQTQQQTTTVNGHQHNGSSSPTRGPRGEERHNRSTMEGGMMESESGNMFVGDWEPPSAPDQHPSEGNYVELRRVKVYKLIGSRWTDRGTAFCVGDFDETAQEAKLIARSEVDPDIALLSFTIRAADVYNRELDTLIVWTEPDGSNYALSFADQEGCSEVWDFIVEVQRHLSQRGLQVVSTQQILETGGLPRPEAGIIGEIEKAIRAYARTPATRDRLCECIQQENYIAAMIEVFQAAEEQEDLVNLHALCSCMQTILLLNEHTMYEHILSDDIWLGVVGMLEYDPVFPEYKANYRDFLSSRSKFLQPVAIEDPSLQRKIHHTYRLLYLKDVILGRALDDQTFNVLNSCIIFNQIDIISHIQSDERFLKDLVGIFLRVDTNAKGKDKETLNDGGVAMDVDKAAAPNGTSSGASSDHPSSSDVAHSSRQEAPEHIRRRDIVLLLQQLCVMGKNVQLPARIGLFKALVERGVLHAVQWALCQHERSLVGVAGEILAVLLDHHNVGVRLHVGGQAQLLGQTPYSKQEQLHGGGQQPQPLIQVPRMPTDRHNLPFKETLAQVLSRMLADSRDLALQNQLADALRLLLDVPAVDPADSHSAVGPKTAAAQMKDEFNMHLENFLDNFYDLSVETLFRPILNDVPEHHDAQASSFRVSRETANLYLYLCDLLCSFVVQHSFRSYFFLLRTNIASRIATLLNLKDKHLCLAALRFFRVCLRSPNKNLHTHLTKLDVFTPIVNLAAREAQRDNLLTSTCQEFFENLRKENNKAVITHIMGQHGDRLRGLARTTQGGSTFRAFIQRHEINIEPPPEDDAKKRFQANRAWGQGRLLETEEEDYFNEEDEDEEPVIPVGRMQSISNFPGRRRPRPGLNPHRIQRPQNVPSQRPQSPLSSLLAYDEDEDVPRTRPEESEGSDDEEAPTSPVLTHRQIQILPYEPPEPSDPEDDLLEAIVTNGASRAGPSTSPPAPAKAAEATPSNFALNVPPMRRDKRRRDDDDGDDDELLERLASKGKRVSKPAEGAQTQKEAQSPKPAAATSKAVEETQGPKRFKLKLGVARTLLSGLTSSAPSSSTSAKDGDEG